MEKIIDFASTAFQPFLQWERLRHPLAGWVRLALGLLLLPVTWSHEGLLLLMTVMALISHGWWFPPYIEVTAPEDTPLMTRLVDAVQSWMEKASAEEKILAFFLPLLALPALLAALWSHNLFWSVYFTLGIAGYKALFLHRLLPEIPAEARARAAARPKPRRRLKIGEDDDIP